MPMPAPLRGVVPPLCTPLTPTGEVDAPSLRSLVERLIGAGARGLFALGSTGETAHLSDSQRTTVLTTTVDAVAGRVPVLAGIIDTGTARVLDHARRAVDAGADALIATAPFYAATHPLETAEHFRRIARSTRVPLIAYDIPSAVHSKLSAEIIVELAADGTLAAIKDSSGDCGAMRRLLVALRTRGLDTSFGVLTGSELAMDGALLAGAHGAVPGLANVDPAGFVRLHDAARAGRWSQAATEQDRLAELFDITDAGDPAAMGRVASAIGAFKAALHLLGVIDCPATAVPQVQLDDAALKTVRDGLARAGLL